MAFRYTFPSRARSLPWVRGIFAGIGIAYSIACLWGNVEYALGRDSSDFEAAKYHLRRAAEVFPLNHGFRLGAAYYFMFLGLDATEDIDKALKTDPNALDLQRYARMNR